MVIEIFGDLEEDIIWNCEESFNICKVYEDNQYWIIIIKSGDIIIIEIWDGGGNNFNNFKVIWKQDIRKYKKIFGKTWSWYKRDIIILFRTDVKYVRNHEMNE